MRKVHHHCSTVIIESAKEGELLMSEYDDTHPRPSFRGKVNFIGGNHHEGDYSPRTLLEREIREELNAEPCPEGKMITDKTLLGAGLKGMSAMAVGNLAPASDITTIRDSVLRNARPYADYLVDIPALDGAMRYHAVQSVFLSVTEESVFELVRKNHSNGLSVKNEGLSRTVHLDELVCGKILTASAAGPIIGDYKGVFIPSPEGFEITKIGSPRKSFSEYFNDFSYGVPI
jgi:8-oxo-dGTP pyrophosphatase MutT (NUDIX family)